MLTKEKTDQLAGIIAALQIKPGDTIEFTFQGFEKPAKVTGKFRELLTNPGVNGTLSGIELIEGDAFYSVNYIDLESLKKL